VAQRTAALVATEPGIEFTVGGGTINLTWANVENVRVNYDLMDVELLFSRYPFVKASGGQFASIKPNATADMKLPAGRNKVASASLGRPANCGTGSRHIRRPDESSTPLPPGTGSR
jgi:hypothetical protein